MLSSMLLTKRDRQEDVIELANDLSAVRGIKSKDVLNKLDKGEEVPVFLEKKLNKLKEEYPTFFDEDSENTTKEGLDQLEEYLKEEVGHITESEPKKVKSEESNKVKPEEGTTTEKKTNLVQDDLNPNVENTDQSSSDGSGLVKGVVDTVKSFLDNFEE
jgi:hypothetical protein